MWPDRVSNPGPLTYESGALPIVLRCPALGLRQQAMIDKSQIALEKEILVQWVRKRKIASRLCGTNC